ncbi:alpha/beta fold hydrolase [Acetobacter sp. TBRC 12305]|uniref:Alpha/beta hydrolase n=1 Tax=Acetobacter garciniae TaxID=2817435 RepID=A0A939HP75_9PROT|nr:alpha/beta hydrolase [Acetobacter garciniae]MBO1325162.1 alpha/beta hydrolase [Acetobacter garciniae]MBX0344867.1 alpha/beta fold hydrolase [Acetobacter garciniae]
MSAPGPHSSLPWGSMSHAARDAAYDNVAAVPGSRDWMAALRARSAAYRARHAATTRDIVWGTQPRQRWNLYPAADPHAPCLVFIHGGYWQWNDPEHFACLAEGMAAQGWSVAMPGHTLAPQASLRAIVAEIDGALDWLAAQGATHGIAGPLVVSGWSAGGMLATLALDHPAVVAGLALSGIYELGPLRDTKLNEALALDDGEIESFSALRRPPSPKPLAIAYGTRELPALCHDSRSLHRLRAAAHRPGLLVPVAGAEHFSILDTLGTPGGELTRVASLLAG